MGRSAVIMSLPPFPAAPSGWTAASTPTLSRRAVSRVESFSVFGQGGIRLWLQVDFRNSGCALSGLCCACFHRIRTHTR